MKKIIVVILSLVMAMSLIACGESAPETPQKPVEPQAPENTAGETDNDGWPILIGDTVNIINTFGGDKTVPHGFSADKFKVLVEKHSGGKITVTNYDNNTLGDDASFTEAIQTGEITMGEAVTSVLGNFVDEMGVFDMPMALTDIDVAYEFLKDSEFRSILNDACEDAGFKLLGMLPTSFRETSSNKEIRSFDDFRGLRIRTLDNKYHREFWKAIGTSPTTVAFSELYMALEQGVIDGQENPLSTIYSQKFYEQQKYVVKTNHIMFILCYYVNADWWNGLDADYQKCISMALEQALDETVPFAKDLEMSSISVLEEKGVEIIELDEETIDKLKEAAEAAYTLVRQDLGDDIVDALVNGLK